MSRFTTVVLLVSSISSELVTAVEADAANVTAVRMVDTAGDDDTQRRRSAWSAATHGRNVYTLVDFDPLADLANAWVDRLQGRSHALDAATGLVEDDDLAEYVLVADDVEGDAVHWYHGLMRGFAPRRIITVKPNPASIVDALAHLKPAPAFPSVEEIVRAALEYVPTGMSAEVAGPPSLLLDRQTPTHPLLDDD